MKTKITILIAIITIITVTVMNSTISQAQPYYQTTTTYDLGNGIYYKSDLKWGALVTLYNSKNIYTYADNTYADGSQYPELSREPLFTMTAESSPNIKNRVNSALTSAQKQIVGDSSFGISVIIDPKTEKIIEIFFRLNIESPYNKLHPSVFRQIELNFINNPTIPGFALSDLGRKLNYVMFSWTHEFK